MIQNIPKLHNYVKNNTIFVLKNNMVETTSLAEYDTKFAKQAALKRAFDASGKSPAEFAEMYGLDENDMIVTLGRQ